MFSFANSIHKERVIILIPIQNIIMVIAPRIFLVPENVPLLSHGRRRYLEIPVLLNRENGSKTSTRRQSKQNSPSLEVGRGTPELFWAASALQQCSIKQVSLTASHTCHGGGAVSSSSSVRSVEVRVKVIGEHPVSIVKFQTPNASQAIRSVFAIGAAHEETSPSNTCLLFAEPIVVGPGEESVLAPYDVLVLGNLSCPLRLVVVPHDGEDDDGEPDLSFTTVMQRMFQEMLRAAAVAALPQKIPETSRLPAADLSVSVLQNGTSTATTNHLPPPIVSSAVVTEPVSPPPAKQQRQRRERQSSRKRSRSDRAPEDDGLLPTSVSRSVEGVDSQHTLVQGTWMPTPCAATASPPPVATPHSAPPLVVPETPPAPPLDTSAPASVSESNESSSQSVVHRHQTVQRTLSYSSAIAADTAGPHIRGAKAGDEDRSRRRTTMKDHDGGENVQAMVVVVASPNSTSDTQETTNSSRTSAPRSLQESAGSSSYPNESFDEKWDHHLQAMERRMQQQQQQSKADNVLLMPFNSPSKQRPPIGAVATTATSSSAENNRPSPYPASLAVGSSLLQPPPFNHSNSLPSPLGGTPSSALPPLLGTLLGRTPTIATPYAAPAGQATAQMSEPYAESQMIFFDHNA